jgi:hypothetical protein
MSRARLGYALACLGILITTGGCAESATAPTEMTAAPAFSRAFGDSVATAHRPGNDEDVITIQSGYLEGGGRY